jgi:hypothetical protein
MILCEKLDDIGASFAYYNKLFKTDDFSVIFYISAAKRSNLLIKGPTTLSKRKKIEFVIYIPYKNIDIFTEQMDYALDFVGQGVKFVFDKYKEDSSMIDGIVRQTKDLIRSDPEKYSKWTK